jgi:hypothetical protein
VASAVVASCQGMGADNCWVVRKTAAVGAIVARTVAGTPYLVVAVATGLVVIAAWILPSFNANTIFAPRRRESMRP